LHLKSFNSCLVVGVTTWISYTYCFVFT